MTARFAVIGNPVAHSLSPRIHAAFAAAEGQDIRYDALSAPVGGFAASAREFFADGGSGLNVTVPFKEDAWRWVDRHDDAAARCGAVNTILMDGDATRGCNTDGAGLVRDMRVNLGWRLVGARTLVIGAGGAARGIIAPLRQAGVDSLTVANRTTAKADALAARFDVAAAGLEEIGDGWDVVVNATSAGLHGAGPLVAPAAVAGARCYDLLYSVQGQTPFCRWAAKHGARETRDGLGMLVEQAALAFALWRGVRPRTRPVLDALRQSAAAPSPAECRRVL